VSDKTYLTVQCWTYS